MTTSDASDSDPPGQPKPDIRVTKHQDGEVQIDRNLKGEGRLARGDRTHFSQLKFRLQAQARTERDPVFDGREPPAPAPEPAPPPPAAAVPSPPPQAPEPSAAEGSAVARLLRRLRFW